MPRHVYGTGKDSTMSEETTAATQETAQAGGFVPITTQAQLDEIIKTRITRERAKYAGFDDYKAKSAEFDNYKATTGAALETTKAQLAEAQAEIAAYKAKEERAAWNAQVSQESGLPIELVAALAADSLEGLQASAKAAAQSVKVPPVPRDPADRKPYAPAAGMQTRDQFAAFAEKMFNK